MTSQLRQSMGVAIAPETDKLFRREPRAPLADGPHWSEAVRSFGSMAGILVKIAALNVATRPAVASIRRTMRAIADPAYEQYDRYEGTLLQHAGSLVTARFSGSSAPFNQELADWTVTVDHAPQGERVVIERGEVADYGRFDSFAPEVATLPVTAVHHAAHLLRNYENMPQ